MFNLVREATGMRCKGAMSGFTVWGWIKILECGQRLKRIFLCGYRLRKCLRLWFLPRNIYDHTAVVPPILRVRLTVKIQKLKYKVKSLKNKPLNTNLICNKTNISPLLATNLFARKLISFLINCWLIQLL